jgi:hypothetical protein
VDGKALAPAKSEVSEVGRLPTAIKMKEKYQLDQSYILEILRCILVSHWSLLVV